jgi:hypothetical protein
MGTKTTLDTNLCVDKRLLQPVPLSCTNGTAVHDDVPCRVIKCRTVCTDATCGNVEPATPDNLPAGVNPPLLADMVTADGLCTCPPLRPVCLCPGGAAYCIECPFPPKQGSSAQTVKPLPSLVAAAPFALLVLLALVL